MNTKERVDFRRFVKGGIDDVDGAARMRSVYIVKKSTVTARHENVDTVEERESVDVENFLKRNSEYLNNYSFEIINRSGKSGTSAAFQGCQPNP